MTGNEQDESTHMMPGDELHGFILQSIDVLDDYHGYGYGYRHRITGMEVYHVANNDSENFFAFIFKTPPMNDFGIPHIIEHCVLAGSKRYPVRDPFMSLLKGSATTFMNAMTYPDYTVYPAASVLPKDFSNLFFVYADAVFNPLLRKETFWQEGIRIVAKEDGQLRFEGVVYNEMLGEWSDHDTVVGRQCVRNLFPDTPYYYEAGGDPQQIINLSYRQFASYYACYYHPSNCRLFFYGDQPITERLALLNDLYLADYSAVNSAGPTPVAKPWNKPKTVTATSMAEESSGNENDASVVISWATTLVEDPKEVLTLSILTDILLGNPGAPLYKTIIDSHLSKDISPVSGMETSFRQMPFTVGFKGIDPSRAKEAQDLILRSLEDIAKAGIPRILVDNAVKRQEFSLQELTGDVPNGMRAMNRAVRGWLQNLSPHVTIRVKQPLEQLKNAIKDAGSPGYFEQWILDHLVNNPHRILLTVNPDVRHNKALQETVEQKIAQIREDLGTEGLLRLQSENTQFADFEQQKDRDEDLATIPRLTVKDLPDSIRILSQKMEKIGDIPLYIQPMETNGIVYLDGIFTIGDLDENEQLLLPLLTRLLHMTGVGGIPYDEMASRIRNRMGGLSFFLENSSLLYKPSQAISFLGFRMKCLERDEEAALKLLSDILRRADVDDQERISSVVNDLLTDYASNVVANGHLYAMQRASSSFSHVLRQNELWTGLTQWFYLAGLDMENQNTVAQLQDRLKALMHKIVVQERMRLHLCASEPALAESKRRVQDFCATFDRAHLPVSQEIETTETLSQGQRIEVFRIPSLVCFNALACPAAQPDDPKQTHQGVLAQILTTNHLWEEVRGKGGAYGVSASIDMLEHLCLFASYRDPRIEGTLVDFRQVLMRVCEEGVDHQLIEQAIISLVSKELRPLYPKEAAIVAFRRALFGITDEFRSQRRSWILATTENDVREAAQDLLASFDAYASIAVIASQQMLEREAAVSERLRVQPITLPL